jgi:hypothetical protein
MRAGNRAGPLYRDCRHYRELGARLADSDSWIRFKIATETVVGFAFANVLRRFSEI